jgi:hypothetical protein
MKLSPQEVLESPDWIVRRALFHAGAKGQGQSDRIENTRRRDEGMARAFGR